jgi:hypothetical protein
MLNDSMEHAIQDRTRTKASTIDPPRSKPKNRSRKPADTSSQMTQIYQYAACWKKIASDPASSWLIACRLL